MVLQQAALVHHCAELIPGDAAAGRLLADVFADAAGAWKPTEAPESLTSALQAFHSFPERTGNAMGDLLGEILALANLIDEQIEGAAVDGVPHVAVWEGLEPLRAMFTDKLWVRASELFPGTVGSQRTWEIPVQPDVAQHLAGFLRQPAAYSLSRLAEIANRDPATAGRLIQAANSPLFSARMRIGSVRHALAYLGENASRRIVTALMARSMFGSSGTLRRLWEHSLKIAQFLENMARDKGFMEPPEALLTGLVHDVGRIALVRQKEAATLARLTEAGNAATWAETLLYGVDHAELGARILESWRFPEEIVEAVRFHHRPAESGSSGAAALYAAEFWSESDEDLPSLRQLHAGLSRIEIRMDELSRFDALDAAVGALLKIA
ncbi:MAG: HDOD domain-containing protein [Bryobacteraceae bacterium]|jgi:putative nucleotidyltransferase with HDIG domain